MVHHTDLGIGIPDKFDIFDIAHGKFWIKRKGGGGGVEMEWVVPFKAKNAVLHRIQKYFPVDS